MEVCIGGGRRWGSMCVCVRLTLESPYSLRAWLYCPLTSFFLAAVYTQCNAYKQHYNSTVTINHVIILIELPSFTESIN